jgi:hypothetical protein
MLTIASATTLSHVLSSGCDPRLTSILNRYRPLVGDQPLAHLFALQPGDTAEHLADVRGRPFEGWEFIDHEDGWYSATFVISDFGEGHVVLIPDQPHTDPGLLAICKAHSS